MIWPFKRRPKNVLGIDIGTSAIRVVELEKHGEQEKLANYGFVSLSPFYEKKAQQPRKDTLLLSSRKIAEILSAILRTARVGTQRAIFSIPDFSTFFTSFTLPPMSPEEIPQAVEFEARRHVPLPLSEVTLNWMVTKGSISERKAGGLEILLVVVPNTTIEQYTRIAELCRIDLLHMEAEVFGLLRALMRHNQQTVALIDIGAQSTTCSIVDQQKLRFSHSFDIAGNDLTERLAQSFELDYEMAEALKEKQGLFENEEDTKKVLVPLLDLMLAEIDKVVQNFWQQEGKDVQAYIIAGGSAHLPGLKQYFAQVLKKEIKTAEPFVNMVYPPILEEVIQDISPAFSVAVGMALKGL